MLTISALHAQARRKTPGTILGLFLALALSGTAFIDKASAASDDVYHIKPQTRMKVAIVEWVAATGEYKEWTALNGEYVVSQSGTISIPMIGEMTVLDKTTVGVSAEIGDRLKQITGLATAPTASVEVVKYPMIYVTGSVEKPSELEFRPGLTVKQAVAMAGGRERRTSPTGEYNNAQQISYAGEINRMELQLKQLGARRARLMAELNDQTTIDFPMEIKAAPEGSAIKQIMTSEIDVFNARAEAMRQQLQAAAELETLLRNEIDILDEKMTSQDEQVKIAQDELQDISKLVDTKILTTSRKTSLERVVADMQSGKLDLVVASMQAKQKLSETQRDALNLKGQRKTEVGQQLQATETEIEDTKLKRNTTLQLLQIAGASLSRSQSMKAIDLQPLEYWITRGGDAGTTTEVQETTEVQPGDVLDVRYNVSGSLDGTVLSSIDPTQSQ
ncbi:polysaccharide biosynthesis/export family protein (plasmid) [Rhizobium sp. CB3171]|uniref:polysaccharide biosynthesis/export family protein n=1 Tax=unclassified Rhizobium TaxID=2613769 RepID=UPI000CDF5546|nr:MULTISPECIES: polysaccharide biosynthesis/export family protein [Rhizobium]AVA25250.1 polysaccharide biosynthesis/export protein [Rhizobium sp. NXC24]MDK4740166.1 polysaccharide biosynthesis/export family protein [Rhizobium sp. CNPSo 3464]UWU25017.1 polysaccharide biosynthesis/export family protein [Rhizobium tropici]WFU06411.1 polysaccharide biosynthesis/export family protein [Rhizobium sp. CB3171]